MGYHGTSMESGSARTWSERVRIAVPVGSSTWASATSPTAAALSPDTVPGTNANHRRVQVVTSAAAGEDEPRAAGGRPLQVLPAPRAIAARSASTALEVAA